jgi:hypothetical protein
MTGRLIFHVYFHHHPGLYIPLTKELVKPHSPGKTMRKSRFWLVIDIGFLTELVSVSEIKRQ